MNEMQMLFPIEPKEFWEKLKLIVEEVVATRVQQIHQESHQKTNPEKMLLKGNEVCKIFSISKPTLYEWMHQGKLVSIKIRSRRFFRSEDVNALIESAMVRSI